PEASSTQTIAATAYLAVDAKAPNVLVDALLDALYENESPLRQRIPTLIPKTQATLANVPLHAEAARYLDPFDGINEASEVLQGLDSLKNLVLGAGLVLLFVWGRAKALK